MKHPLTGAYKRIERADKHLQEIKSEVEILRQTQYDHMTVEHNPKTQKALVQYSQLIVPWCIVLAVSDCIHSFRSALDYIIYELAKADSLKVQDGTQFLIEDTPEGFRKKVKRRLKGLTSLHVNAVESYQPYKGVNWTKTLRDISNPDKHRELTVVDSDAMRDFTMKFGNPGSFDGLPGKVFHGAGRGGAFDMHVERKCTISIAFSNELLVIETLDVMKSQVAQTVEFFKPEFKI